MGSTFGNLFRITTYGESHGAGVGVVVDGCPAGLAVSEADIQYELDRRRPGQSSITTQRKEADQIQVYSGIRDGITLGTPIGMMTLNQDARPKAYNNLTDLYRPGHADYVYDQRYGLRDERGGGRSSNRESIGRVAAGAIAKKLNFEVCGIRVLAWVAQIHHIAAELDMSAITPEQVEANITRCPDPAANAKMVEAITTAKQEGESLGGLITFRVDNCPPGLGAPVFDKLSSDLARALMSINATRSYDIGLGRDSILLKGSQHNDEMYLDEQGRVRAYSNNAGGVLGGISNGEQIWGSLSFKPTATLSKKQKTVNRANEEIEFRSGGRHDPCVLPRAVPIVEAMIQLVLAEHVLSFPLASLERLRRAYR